MSEHFTRNTTEATAFCKRCEKNTQHRVDDGRLGPCLDPNHGRSVLAIFCSTLCVCGHKKEANTGFCRGCYFRLPREMQNALWKRFGEGFETAFHAARKFLEEAPKTKPPQSGELFP